MTEQEKIALLEETLDAEEGSLKADMELSEVEEYDSMAKLSIIVMMEDEFGKKLSADEVRSFKKVQDILNYMEK